MPADPRDVLSRPAREPDRTLRYGTDPNQLVDLHLPPDGTPDADRAPLRQAARPDADRAPLRQAARRGRPPVVFVHGGFWMAEWDRRHIRPLAEALAARGHPVASVEYRRVGQPGGGWRGTFDDVAAGVRAAADLTAQAGPPVVAGHSAGGQLALWVASRAGAPVAGVLALAPVADLPLGYALGLGDGAVGALLGGAPDQVPDRYAYAEPGPPGVPTVLVHGTEDRWVPVELSRAYAARTGSEVRLVELPGVGHFAPIDPVSGAWPAVLSSLDQLA
jgi:acetyl esterase/lipase